MQDSHIHRIITLCALLGCPITHAANLCEILNWQPDPSNICEGYFLDPPTVAHQLPKNVISESVTTLHAQGTSTFTLHGESQLTKNVNISQPGRLLRANTARVRTDPKTEKISTIDLRGNVRYNEMHKELAGEHILIDLPNNKISLWDGAYRLERPSALRNLQSWGTAKTVQSQNKIITIERASYTTCPLCQAPLWQLKAKDLSIDQNKGKAVGHNVTLEIKNVPVLYTPYISYSINKERKTGFLIPTFSYNHHDGATITQPYYLNLAPNYDATLTPIEFQLRGFAMNGEFRYLTQQGSGNFYAAIIPYDQEFSHFQQLQLTTPEIDPATLPYVNKLESSSTTRWQIASDQGAMFTKNFNYTLVANWVSDDYYMQDFGQGPRNTNANNLLNQLNFNYDDQYWHLLARAQSYLTLHPLYCNSTGNQYNRLPQLEADGDWLTGCNSPHYILNTQYINFDQRRNFVTNETVVTGQRLNVHPGLALPLQNAYAFFTPRADLDYTFYSLRDLTPETPQKISRFVPISTVDAGLFYDRQIQCLNTHFTQTLEPRAYYVYIPNREQDEIPLFDTYLPTFSYEQLFKPNRYTGLDRINSANELTLALSSRFLNTEDGSEKLMLLVAMQYYFQAQVLNMGIADTSDSYNNNSTVSPIIAAANYHFTPQTWGIINYVWDPDSALTTSANAYLYFHGPDNRVFSLGYDFVRGGDEYTGDPSSDLSRFDIMLATGISEHWTVLGNFNYNVSHNHTQYGLIGLEYQGCCFAFRSLASRTIINESAEANNNYDNRFYIQLDLKGLATVSNTSPETIISTRLPGYRDYFRN